MLGQCLVGETGAAVFELVRDGKHVTLETLSEKLESAGERTHRLREADVERVLESLEKRGYVARDGARLTFTPLSRTYLGVNS